MRRTHDRNTISHGPELQARTADGGGEEEADRAKSQPRICLRRKRKSQRAEATARRDVGVPAGRRQFATDVGGSEFPKTGATNGGDGQLR